MKVLNIYGTYKSPEDFNLKIDVTDEGEYNTVTLILGQNYIKTYEEIIAIDTCIRIDNPNVLQIPNDGGSIDFSLNVNARTTIIVITSFGVELFFVRELSIRSFLEKKARNASLKSTIVFVIIQVDNILKAEGGVFEQLKIADGPSPLDRATLTFVNKKKYLYHRMVDDFCKGTIVPILARNIGVWKDRSNTLSILDITMLASVHSVKKKQRLEEAFNTQIRMLGYRKKVCGVLHIRNFNGTLIIPVSAHLVSVQI